MKKILFSLTILALALSLEAQESDSTGSLPMQLARHHGHLYEAEMMGKISLHSSVYLLSPESFNLYYKARREYVSALVLWSVGGVAVTGFLGYASWNLITSAIHTHPTDPNHPTDDLTPLFTEVSLGMALGSAILFFTPALWLTLDSYKKINHIVSDYNQRRNHISLHFGPTRYGIGLSLNF